METARGIRRYGIALIIYGVYNLIGIGSFGQFAMMFKPLPQQVIFFVYVFTIFYGICGVYCGTRILRLEDWARKLVVGLTSVSVVSGLLLNRMVMGNFREYLASEASKLAPDMVAPVYKYAVILSALLTLFELSVIYYFTRPVITRQFE